jgi:Phage P22-like portal protein
MAYKKKTATKPRDNETPDNDNKDFVRKAIAKYERAFEKERTNIVQALEDLEFRAGEHWPTEVKRERERDYRPALTINKIPTYVRQIVGDIRLLRPSIKVVPVDSRGDPKTAEVLGGLVRYIENRSDAQHAYAAGADSQVASGIGHWRVLTEYADDSTFDQEIRISTVADGVGVVWDPDAILPNKEDARCCFVPVDLSHDEFKERYPDAPIEDFTLTLEGRTTLLDEWFGDDFVRVAEYWERRPEKRILALLPDGAIDDVTDQPGRLADLRAAGARVEERESHRVYRSVISSCHLLEEPKPWPGRFIPIVPVIGEEVVIGRRTVRHGIVRYLKDPQRAYNYFRSAETEAVALQPKAPWLVTEKNIEDHQDQWLTANTRNYPYLLYKPDTKNGNVVPQRVSARMDTGGMVEGLQISINEMKEVTGIYDAAIGQKSNETSGKAILARQNESDVGSYVYVENFSRAIKHTGRIVLDLIPHIYDAQRTITFLQQAPSAAPMVLDLIANAQDWPNADKFSKRLKTLLPPTIQAMEAQESGELPPPPAPPPPEAIIEQQKLEVEHQKMQVDQLKVQADLQKAEMSLAEKQMEFASQGH